MTTERSVAERKFAEQSLLDSEQRYKRLLASVTDYVYTVTVERGQPLATSHGPGCEAVTGYTSAEFDADPFLWYRMIYDEDRPAVLAQAERILNGEAPAPLEHRVVHRNGSIRWIRNTPVPHKDDLGRLVGYDGLVSDITERRRAESKFRAVLESAPDAMVIVNQAGNIVLVNAQTERIFGYRREELYGQPVELLMPERFRHSHVAHRHSYSDNPHIRPMSAALNLFGRRKDGSEFPAEISLSPLETEEGVMTFSTLRDITERKQAEEQIRLSEARLQAILDNSPAVIYLKDTQGRYLLINRRFEDLFHVKREEVAGKTDHDLLPEEIANAVRANDQKVIEAKTPFKFEEVVPHNGKPHTYISVKFPLLDASAVSYAVCGISTDITERKQAEEELQQAYAELENSEEILKRTLQELEASHEELKATELQLIQAAKLEAIGTMAAGIAHEVKNPLQTILMGLHYLANAFPANHEGITLAVRDMRDAVQRANSIIRELLHFSAATPFETKAEDLNAFVERSLWLINSELIASQITVVRQLAADLPRVQADRGKMEQVFLNLILNALQSMSQGGILTVATRAVQLGEDLALQERIFRPFKPGETVVIAEVQDTGTGISEADLPRIFDPFFTTKPVGTGTGLGLSVVKKILDLHGGAIDIRNAPERGVRATVVLKTAPEKTV